MEKTLRKAGRQAAGLLASAATLALPMVALAEVDYTKYLGAVQTSAGLPEGDLMSVIGVAIATVMGILGVVLVIYILWAGWQWMTAGSDAGKVTKAKDQIKNAVIGLAIVFISYAITRFVMDILVTTSRGQAS